MMLRREYVRRPLRRRTLRAARWCINCYRRFGRNDVRYWYGAPGEAGEGGEVGPFCEGCDRVIKLHTNFHVTGAAIAIATQV